MPDSEWKLRIYRGYYCVARSEGGSTKRQSLRTRDRDVAERAFRDLLARAKKPTLTVADIMAEYLADRDISKRAPERLRYAWARAKDTFGHLRPDQIDRPLCRRYAASRTKQGVGAGTIRKELETVRSGLSWAKRGADAVFDFPAPPPAKDRVLTREEFARLLRAARPYPHVRAFVALALGTAGRQAALLELTWDRVDFRRGLIQLATSETHGKKTRATVPMTRRARRYLLVLKRSALSPFVIEWGGRRVLSIKKGFAAACRRADLADVTPHTLRHTAASWMAMADEPMVQIAAYLGHSDSRLTERRYSHVAPNFLRRAARALD